VAPRKTLTTQFLGALGYGYASAGRTDDARRVLEELGPGRGDRYVAAMDRAKVYAGLGRIDEAFAWLDRAYTEKDAWLVGFRFEVGFDPLKQDPRYGGLMQRMGIPSSPRPPSHD